MGYVPPPMPITRSEADAMRARNVSGLIVPNLRPSTPSVQHYDCIKHRTHGKCQWCKHEARKVESATPTGPRP